MKTIIISAFLVLLGQNVPEQYTAPGELRLATLFSARMRDAVCG